MIKTSEILVIVDDGHGLETSGKRTPKFQDGTQIKENIFNHATKVLLINQLNKLGIDTYDVSPERTDTPLKTRTNRANDKLNKNEYEYYIFVSIHFNAIGYYWDDKVGGIETYHYPNSEPGKRLATKVHKKLLKGTNLRDRKVKSANFHVLRETAMPAILCECGFMSNKVEADLMDNLSYQKECSTEITKGIFDYFGLTYPSEKIDISDQKTVVSKNSKDELEKLLKIVSPEYYDVWLKHMRANMKYNWQGLLENALLNKSYKK